MDVDEPSLRIDSRQIAEQAYAILRDLILKSELPPGERINVDAFSAKMGISRTPVIYALHRLQAERLVHVVPRKAAFVRGLSFKELSEMLDVRLALELYGLHRACLVAGQEVIAEVRRLLVSMEATALGETWMDYGRFIELDRAFHRTMMKPVGNEYLLGLYDNLSVHWQVARSFYTRKSYQAALVLAEHRDLFHAYEAKATEALREAITRHVESTRARVESRLEVAQRS